jgi:hypothetical protein
MASNIVTSTNRFALDFPIHCDDRSDKTESFVTFYWDPYDTRKTETSTAARLAIAARKTAETKFKKRRAPEAFVTTTYESTHKMRRTLAAPIRPKHSAWRPGLPTLQFPK